MNKVKEFLTILFTDPTPAILHSPVKIPLLQLDRGSLELMWDELNEDCKTVVKSNATFKLDRLLLETKIFTSIKTAREKILAGAIYLNDIKVIDPNIEVDSTIWINPPKERIFQNKTPYLFIRKGKKTYHMVQFV